MKLVIDTNIIISALMRDSLARIIILEGNLDLISPEFTLDEVNKYEQLILDKSGLSEGEFEDLFLTILDKIEIIPKEEYSSYMVEAENLMGKIDIKDVPFVACALAMDADGLYSEDRHFEGQDRIKLFKTKDVLEFLDDNFVE